MPVQLAKRLITVSDYHLMGEVNILKPDDRVELIRGEIIEMSPIGSKHAHIVDRLAVSLITQLGTRAVVRIQNPIAIDDYSEPEPDVVIAKAPIAQYRDHHPRPDEILLVVEVANSSLKYDQKIKLPLFAEVGIPEVWVINLENGEVEVHQQPGPQGYSLRKIMYAGDILKLASLEIEIPVDEVI